jgi:hypothetical protein
LREHHFFQDIKKEFFYQDQDFREKSNRIAAQESRRMMSAQFPIIMTFLELLQGNMILDRQAFACTSVRETCFDRTQVISFEISTTIWWTLNPIYQGFNKNEIMQIGGNPERDPVGYYLLRISGSVDEMVSTLNTLSHQALPCCVTATVRTLQTEKPSSGLRP